MADILKPHFGPRPREAVCTGSVPSEPTNLRDLAPDNEVDIALAALGLGKSIPHHPRSTRVAVKTLRELRERVWSIARQASETASAADLIGVEAMTLAKVITEIIGDDKPDGAA